MNLNLNERITKIITCFRELQQENSRNEKKCILDYYYRLNEQLKNDILFCFEILAGKHKLGYTFMSSPSTIFEQSVVPNLDVECSLEEFLGFAYLIEDYSNESIQKVVRHYSGLRETTTFINNLLNRNYRLGIGLSELKKSSYSPMLAKKYDSNKCPSGYPSSDFYITEKLDGNRCIARYEEGGWKFYSRSDKPLKVDFDMSTFNKLFVYDGEILSIDQVENPGQQNFNVTSGIINSNNGDKNKLIYTVFDIIDNKLTYCNRRTLLNQQQETCNVKVLPVLGSFVSWGELNTCIALYLDEVTSRGGEGLMINVGDAYYQNKRTDVLLKVKQVQTMDMKVVYALPGTGKNEGIVGSLICEAYSRETNILYRCRVGSGLSDKQRNDWADNIELILNKIVEVAYFSTSQDANNKGTNIYSLRFPRFKQVREDKKETSIY